MGKTERGKRFRERLERKAEEILARADGATAAEVLKELADAAAADYGARAYLVLPGARCIQCGRMAVFCDGYPPEQSAEDLAALAKLGAQVAPGCPGCGKRWPWGNPEPVHVEVRNAIGSGPVVHEVTVDDLQSGPLVTVDDLQSGPLDTDREITLCDGGGPGTPCGALHVFQGATRAEDIASHLCRKCHVYTRGNECNDGGLCRACAGGDA